MSVRNNDIHIGEHERIQWVDFDAANSELFDVDHVLDKYNDFWLSLQLECVAECCGLDAFRFYPEDIANAYKQYAQTPLKEDLLRLRKELTETDKQIVVSRCLNNLVEKGVFVKLLDHIYKFLICMILVCIPWTAMLAQKSGYADGRPAATKRIACLDEGIVMRFGSGPDSCDTYGAREAIVNREGDDYYLFYDGAGKDGWKACLAISTDLRSWTKKGAILALGAPGTNDSKSASSPWVIKAEDGWHMFYLGTPNTSPAPDCIPAFPYLTMKARSASLAGPWIKDYTTTPFTARPGTFYTVTASPGFIVRTGDSYLQFFSGATSDSSGTRRTLGIARTKDLNKEWTIDEHPIVPLAEQVENSSLYFEEKTGYWWLFTNHIGLDKNGVEYTDAIWVYWSKNLNKWNAADKAIVLDSQNCSWAKGAIGMPSVIRVGDKLALLYDAPGGASTSHMRRNIGLAWLKLPMEVPK